MKKINNIQVTDSYSIGLPPAPLFVYMVRPFFGLWLSTLLET